MACIIGPEKVVPKHELGFSFKESSSNLCKSCSVISIDAPQKYNGHLASHVVFTVHLNGELISKSVSLFKTDTAKAEFVGVVRKEKGVSYEINVEYGEGRCMAYRFTYRN